MGMGTGKFTREWGWGWGIFFVGTGWDGENFMGTGWGWGKFYGDGVGMGTVLFTVSLSTPQFFQVRLDCSPKRLSRAPTMVL